jgi:hypothetical protein
MPLSVVVIGNPFVGLRLFGPFEAIEDAYEWANTNRDEFYVITLEDPV